MYMYMLHVHVYVIAVEIHVHLCKVYMFGSLHMPTCFTV